MLYLDHVIENEVGEYSEGVGPHDDGVVMKPGVHTRGPRLDCVGESGRGNKKFQCL